MVERRISKTCSICEADLPLDHFSRLSSSPDGLRYQCRACAKEKIDAWRRANRDRLPGYYKTYRSSRTEEQRQTTRAQQREAYRANPLAHRDGYLQRTYGIGQAGYDELLRAQGGRCSICATDDPGGDRRFFAVDHDHKCCPDKKSCGKCVRGLLCMNCNQGLGKFRDDVNLMARAIAYLTEEAMSKTTVNKDGSVTTSVEDEFPAQQEAKVVEAPAKDEPKSASRAESK